MRYIRRALGLTWPAASVTAAVTLASFILLGGLAADPSPAAAAITGSPIYWGTYISGAPADTRLIDAFEAAIGKKESIVHWGQPWYNGGTAQTFQTARYNNVRARGSIPMVTWGSWDRAKNSKDQPDFRLSAITAGKYDAYITQWAKDAKAWGHPFFLRFDMEMNGDWQFPWAEKVNGNKPGDFVNAWRHVHDIFTRVGATNATWVWCPNVSGAKTTPMKQLWPGANYADWTCLDGYNGAGSQGQQWLTFSQVFNGGVKGHGNSYDEIESIAPGKPVMIGETSTSEKGGSKANWITSALTSELPGSFPGIQAVVWTDWNAGDPNLDWPIDSSSASHAAFATAIGSALFASNDFGDLAVAPIPAANRVTHAQPAAAPAPAPDPRYFDTTHFRIDDDRIWSYFQSRGGLDVFGYPVSRTFTLLGCQSQIFQREVAQVCSDGSPRLLNLLDPDIFPYTQVNGSTLPDVDDDLKSQTPTLDDPNYADDMLAFVQAEAPDSFDGQSVNFGSTFFSLITPQMAGVDGPLLGLINLEVWGAPISQPMADPSNANFIYQRFQRGIMHYDASTGVTRGLLLADYLKAVITGQNVPGDLADQAAGGALYQQYCPGMARSLCRPDELPGTDLTSAFDAE